MTSEEQRAPTTILTFTSSDEWKRWLAKNHAKSDEVWLKFFRKGSNVPSITHAEALDEALCFGWIDGQAQGIDETSWRQKFTPRRARSIWSKRNTERVKRLMQEGRMKRSGLKEVEAAKADGRWRRAYDSPKSMVIPQDFMSELAKNKKALAFFQTLNRANTYAIGWRLQTAKTPETRERRMKAILAKLAKRERFH
jgi:uncharacterized protein YdeI (YjbR/CyaY-like superfamily)